MLQINTKSFPLMKFNVANKALLESGGRIIKFGGRVFIVIGVASIGFEIYEIQKDPMGYWKSLKNSTSELLQIDKNKITNYEKGIIELRNLD